MNILTTITKYATLYNETVNNMIQQAEHVNAPEAGDRLPFLKIAGIGIGIVFLILLIAFLSNWYSNNKKKKRIENENPGYTVFIKDLTQGDTVFFNFGETVGVNPDITYRAYEEDVDFEILNQSNETYRSYQEDANVKFLRPEHFGVSIVSHNKDTKMEIKIRKK